MKIKICSRAGEQGGIGKKLAIIAGILVLLLVVSYFVVTSSGFFKGVILPKVAKSLNAEITVADASISPFSRVELKGLVMKTTGTEPLVTAEQVRLRYSLMDIIKGNINVHEVSLLSPVINVVTEPDGSSNLDPLLKKDEKKEKEEDDKSKDEPAQLSIRNVSLQNGTLRQVKKEKDGTVASTELKNLNLSLDQLGNGQSGSLKVGSDVTMATKRPKGTNDLLQARLGGNFNVALTKDLLPASVKGQSKVEVSQGEGGFSQVKGLVAELDSDLSPTEIRQVALKFSRGTEQLGQLRVFGPFDLNTQEGRLQVEISSLDKNVLNFAGVGKGWDFRNSTISSTNQVDISQKGSFIALAGKLTGTRVSIAQAQQTTPEVNLGVDYQVSANLNEKTALLQRLNLAGEQEGKQFLTASLDKEMNLSWGEAVKGYKDAALQLNLTNFNLAQWRPVVGTNVVSGLVNLAGILQAQKDGKLLNTDLKGSIQGLGLDVGTNSLRDANVTLAVKGTVEEMKLVNLNSYSMTVAQKGQNVVAANGALRHDLEKKESQVQTTAEVSLPRLLALYPVSGAQAQAGILKLTATVLDANQGQKRTLTGNVGLEGFTGGYEKYAFSNYNVALDLNTEIDQQVMNIRRGTARFAEGFESGGSVDLNGKYNLENKSGQFAFKTVGLNERTFRPVLAPSLGENQLVSIKVDASGNASLDPAGESSIKTEVKVTDWLVQDKEGKLPKTPLAASVTVDGGMKGEFLDLRNFLLKLTPTERAKNELQLIAKLDFGKTNPVPSTVSLRSESFDVTPYYNMFAGGTPTNAAGDTSPVKPPGGDVAAAPVAEEKEPEPMTLPFQNLTAELKLDRFFLREMAISNWTGTVLIRSNVVGIKPFQMTLNGGPVDLGGTVDVGQPGYRYNLNFNAQDVPLAPLVNSFATNSAGKIAGTFLSKAEISGAGMTGSNLQKNLKGNASFSLTNMNYQVVGPKLRKILTPIAAVLRAPELLQTPVNWVSGKTQIGNGTVQLQDVGVESEAFFAKAQGTIQLAAVLTNSALNIPLELHLRRSLAEKSKLLPPNTPEDAKYAALPSFVTVKGTLGEPSSDINELAIVKLGAIGAANIGGKDVGKVLQGIDILSGSGKTNASGTNQSTGGNLLRGLGGLFGKDPETTNAPATKSTNAPPAASTNQNAAADLVRGLGSLFGKDPATTNQPAGNTNAPAPGSTNAPASTNQPKKVSPFDLLRALPGSEK